MTSEIRTNSIKSRTGLSTVSYADTGIIVSGIVTATSFSGDGSDLTGVSGVSVANQADNRLITCTGTTDSLNGEANLTFDGSAFNLQKTGAPYILVGSTNAGGASLVLDGDSNGDASGIDYAMLTHNTDGDLDIVVDNPANAGNIKFFTNSTTERLRITSDGRVLIGTSSAFATGQAYRLFQIGQADGGWINLARTGVPSSGNHLGAIQGFTRSADGNYHDTTAIDFKADGTVSNSSKPSRIEFFTTSSSSTSKTERLRITSGGGVKFINADSPSSTTEPAQILNHAGGWQFYASSDSSTHNNIIFGTNSVSAGERLRITSDGVITCGHGSEINLHGSTTTGICLNGNGNSGQIIANASGNRALIIGRQGSYGQVIEFFHGNQTNEASITIPAANTFAITTNGNNERLRITSGGKLLHGTTTDYFGGTNVGVSGQFSVGDGTRYRRMYQSGNGHFYFWNGSNQPYISSSGNWNNSSDENLKKDITDLSYGIDSVKNLKPRKFKMKSNDITNIGFIAQEVESVIPEVVDAGETPDGTEQKGLSYGNLTAVLTKALQEAIAKIEKLEQDNIALRARVTNLEGN